MVLCSYLHVVDRSGEALQELHIALQLAHLRLPLGVHLVGPPLGGGAQPGQGILLLRQTLKQSY